jgi:DNA-binding GntR family transcriptional regulator
MNKNLPLYVQIANKMRENIRIGKWKKGEKIPTEYQLCDIYHVSRITIRSALDELVKENLLVKKKPVGTFVTESQHIEKDMYTVVKSFTREMEELGIKAETQKVTVTKSHADANIANFLKINVGEPVVVIKRLRGEKDNTFAYFITYFKYDEKFSLDNNDYRGSFYKYLSSLGISIVNNQEIVEAMLPNHEVASNLNISKNTPVLKRTRFTNDITNNFYEYTECYYIGSDYRYYLDFT